MASSAPLVATRSERLEQAASAEALAAEVWEGMRAHEALFVRPMQDEDVTRLLRLEIRRISAYDIERNRSEIAGLEARIAEIDAKLADLEGTAIGYVRESSRNTASTSRGAPGSPASIAST